MMMMMPTTMICSRSRDILLRGRPCIRKLTYHRTLLKQNKEHEIQPDSASVSTEIKMKNAALATSLLAFCFGVAWYSMYAVGQAGGGAEDPLAALVNEAASAQQKHEREERQANDANKMLKEFQSGGYDPDKYEEEEELMNSRNKKRPWYKFW
jgi:hypothetical protein